MKAIKILVFIVLAYVGVVVAFESLLGYFQPASASTMVIATTGGDGARSDRVLAQAPHDDKLYAAANHWPRAWYREALANPQVQVTIDGITADYTAVPVEGAEHDAVNASRPLGTGFRILTGFPPRYFVRLDPR
jgi:hypothetical protein